MGWSRTAKVSERCEESKELEIGKKLHAEEILAILSRRGEEIEKRREGLRIAREVLGKEFEEEFKIIEEQLK